MSRKPHSIGNVYVPWDCDLLVTVSITSNEDANLNRIRRTVTSQLRLLKSRNNNHCCNYFSLTSYLSDKRITSTMSSTNDTTMEDTATVTNQPFTVEENIQQLNAIDKDIVQLMKQTAAALNDLTTPSSSLTGRGKDEVVGSSAALITELHPEVQKGPQKEEFKSATNAFLATLHSIDVRMKRQILALEEGGIISLSSTPRQDQNGTKATLKPNGAGSVGSLDVGWLNSRGTRVERDMEAELWSKARQALEREDGIGSKS